MSAVDLLNRDQLDVTVEETVVRAAAGVVFRRAILQGADPTVPADWHGVVNKERGTVVYIHV